MRKMPAMLLAAVLVLALPAKAGVESYDFSMKQEVCDSVRYEIAYDLTFIIDTLSAETDTFVEPMHLQIGDKAVRFFSYAAFRNDSVNAVNYAKGIRMMRYGEAVSWQVYKNYPEDGCFTFLDDIARSNYYAVTEPVKSPEWTSVQDSTATILGYQCRLATAWFKGRRWFAWYAEDIPIDAGPWKLGGLPGLILSAYDAGRQYVFVATGMREVAPAVPMMYQGVEYEPVTYAELMKEYRRFYADPFGYDRLYNHNSRIVYEDDNGNQMPDPKNMPFNPIELAE